MSIKEFPTELQYVYRTLSSYYTLNVSVNEISVDDLANVFFSSSVKDKEYYEEVFNNLRNISVSEYSVLELAKGIKRSKLQKDLALAAYDAAEGKEDKTLELWEKLQQLTTQQAVNENEFSFVSDDLQLLVDGSVSKPGLRWRLDSLNKSLGSLRRGDFGFIFARPETGKTTFLASECSFMAGQAEGPILHLNNEQMGEAVMLRYYQAALGCTMEQMYSDMAGCKKRFLELTKGNIRLYDSGSIHYKQVERLCASLSPSLIIYDQIDKIKGFDNDREDLRLGTIYQWARELSKEYCPSIGVCQADGTGEGQRWLTMGNVANAKTSKQAEADWILGIGKVSDPGYEKLRFMAISKNKLMGDKDTDHNKRHGRWETILDAETARYVDL